MRSRAVLAVLVLAPWMLGTGCVASRPVTEPTANHLGFTVNAPGIEGWRYQEKRSADSWWLQYPVLIQLTASKRHPLAEERPSVALLAESLVGSMEITGLGS